MNANLLEDILTGQFRLRQRDDEWNADHLVVLRRAKSAVVLMFGGVHFLTEAAITRVCSKTSQKTRWNSLVAVEYLIAVIAHFGRIVRVGRGLTVTTRRNVLG